MDIHHLPVDNTQRAQFFLPLKINREIKVKQR